MSEQGRGKVSVVITTKNCEDTILKCLRSVREQTYDGAIEIILVDSSTDKTVDIARPYVDKVIKTPASKGLGYAMARGVLAATGEYVMSLDGDAWIDRHWIEHAVSLLERGYSLVGSKALPANPTLTGYFFANLWNAMRKPTGNAMMFRRADYFMVGGYCPFYCTPEGCVVECDYSRYEDKVLLEKLSSVGKGPTVMGNSFVYTAFPNTTQQRWLLITSTAIASGVAGGVGAWKWRAGSRDIAKVLFVGSAGSGLLSLSLYLREVNR